MQWHQKLPGKVIVYSWPLINHVSHDHWFLIIFKICYGYSCSVSTSPDTSSDSIEVVSSYSMIVVGFTCVNCYTTKWSWTEVLLCLKYWKCCKIQRWCCKPVIFPAGPLLIQANHGHLRNTWVLTNIWQAQQTSIGKCRQWTVGNGVLVCSLLNQAHTG